MPSCLILLWGGIEMVVYEAGKNSAVAVTPNDGADLANGATKALYIGGAGNVAVTMADGTSVTLTALAVGVVHPLSVKRVKATNTTATSIIALY